MKFPIKLTDYPDYSPLVINNDTAPGISFPPLRFQVIKLLKVYVIKYKPFVNIISLSRDDI